MPVTTINPIAKTRANIPDENLMTEADISAMLSEAEQDILSGRTISMSELKQDFNTRYGLHLV